MSDNAAYIKMPKKGKDEDLRPKVVIIGIDFQTFQMCWNDFFKRKIRIHKFIKIPKSYMNKTQNQSEKDEEELNAPLIIRRAKDSIKVAKLEDLEKIIVIDKIEKCFILMQSVSNDCIKSIVYRIMTIGTCAIEYIQPKESAITSCKPTILVSSVAENVGKTQFIRYCTSYLRQYRKIAVIIPIVQINDKILNLINDLKPACYNQRDDDIFALHQNDELPSFEFLNFEQAKQKREWLSDKTLQEIEGYFKSGAFCVYATANINKALMQAERRAHIIFYDCDRSEIPLIKTKDQVCIATYEALCNIEENCQWPGLVNLFNSKKIVFITKGKKLINEELMLNLVKKLEENTTTSQQNMNLKSKQVIDDSKEEKFFFVNTINEDEDKSSDATNNDNDDTNLSLVNNNSNNTSSSIELTGSNVSINAPPTRNNNENDYSMNIISLPQDLVSFNPNMPVVYPTIYDPKNSIHDWLSSFFITLFTPPLQKHFESQVGILMSLDQASEKELCVTNHTSANRGALCRLFLSSHLPPGYRVTNGEILDAKGNSTGQLEVVIVNDSAPYMTIGSNNSVIAPILADTVLCVVEVKTLIDPENLRKSLSQLRPVKALMPMHKTLEKPDGGVVADPLGGKILTGIFGFNMNNETIDQAVPEILRIYPNVVDFIVIPNRFGYFLVETLKVCGIDATLSKSKIVNGYVRYDANGIELALIFGILNSIAAIRRFSGSNCVRYLSGKWDTDSDRKNDNDMSLSDD